MDILALKKIRDRIAKKSGNIQEKRTSGGGTV